MKRYLMIVVFLLIVLFVLAARVKIDSFAVYYGTGNFEKLKNFDLTIVAPGTYSADQLDEMVKAGKYPVVYISVGELAPGDPAYFSINPKDLGTVNEIWGSTRVAASSRAWRDIVIRRIRSQLERGFTGIFMDTVDSNPDGVGAMADFIREIRDTFPDMIIIQNGAFDRLEKTGKYIDFVLWESFATTFNFNTARYEKAFIDDLLIKRVQQLSKKDGFGVLSLSYAAPEDKELRTFARNFARKCGFIPYVSTLYLERVYDAETEEKFQKPVDFLDNNVLGIDLGAPGDRSQEFYSFVYGEWSDPVYDGGHSYREAGIGWNSFVVLTLREKANTSVYILYKDEVGNLPAGYVFLIGEGSLAGNVFAKRIFLKGLQLGFSGEYKREKIDIWEEDIFDIMPEKEGIQIALGFRGVKVAQLGSSSDIKLAEKLIKPAEKKDLSIEIPSKPDIATITIFYTDEPPTIDGVMEDNWKNYMIAVLNDETSVGYLESLWDGPEDLSAKVYSMWDEEKLYLFFDITDDRLRQTQQGVNMWKGDHVELWFDTSFLDVKAKPANNDDFQIGLSTGDFDSLPPEAWIWVPFSDEAFKEICVAATKTEQGYTLEASIPWSILGMEVKSGLVFAGGFMVSDTDTDGPSQETIISTSQKLLANWGMTNLFNNIVLGNR